MVARFLPPLLKVFAIYNNYIYKIFMYKARKPREANKAFLKDKLN